MDGHLHVFLGSFEDLTEAIRYTLPQWEPEPDESVSDEEYAAWEDRNPSRQMNAELGDDVYLDEDFIEVIEGDDRFDYLDGELAEKGAVEQVREQSKDGDNVLVLIHDEALGGFPQEMRSTSRLTYCGRFACKP